MTPTVAVTAFEAGTLGVDEIDGRAVDPHLGWSPFSWPINLAGLPAATIPCGFDRDGLPIGLQIVAPWLEEGRIFRVAAAFEAARPWLDRWPTLRCRVFGGSQRHGDAGRILAAAWSRASMLEIVRQIVVQRRGRGRRLPGAR